MSRRVVWWMTVPLLLMWLGCVCGCAMPANPGTFIKFNPWTGSVTFEDSRDNNIEVENLEVDLPNKTCKVGKLVVTMEASAVRQANVEQLVAFSEQTKAVSQAITGSIAAVASVLPGVGGGGGAMVNTSCPTADLIQQLKALRAIIKDRGEAVPE